MYLVNSQVRFTHASYVSKETVSTTYQLHGRVT